MIDRLRSWLNRPLADGERRRLFVVAVVVLLAAAGALTALDRPGREPVSAPARRDSASRELEAEPARPAPTSLEVPSEEGRLDPAQAASTSEVAAARRAARRFLRGYLPYTYGRGSPSSIAPASPRLLQRLAQSRPRVPARERGRRARIVVLQPNGAGRVRAGMIALVDDGARRYTVGLELERRRSGWLVTDVGG